MAFSLRSPSTRGTPPLLGGQDLPPLNESRVSACSAQPMSSSPACRSRPPLIATSIPPPADTPRGAHAPPPGGHLLPSLPHWPLAFSEASGMPGLQQSQCPQPSCPVSIRPFLPLQLHRVWPRGTWDPFVWCPHTPSTTPSSPHCTPGGRNGVTDLPGRGE